MDQKLDDILKQVAEIFFKYGVHAVSMDDICRELGISKKTLYKYVANKADLVKKSMLHALIATPPDLKCFATREGNAIDHLLELSIFIQKKLSSSAPSLSFELQKYYPEFFRHFQQIRKEIGYKYLIFNMQKGISEGIYRTDLDVDLVAKIYIQKMEAINDPEFLKEEKSLYSKIFQVMFENHIRGISNQSGVEYYEKLLGTINNKLI